MAKQTFNVITTATAKPNVVAEIEEVKADLERKRKEKAELDITESAIKTKISYIRDQWAEFDRAYEDGINGMKVVDRDTGEVLVEASKARASNTYDMAGFLREWLVTSGLTVRKASNCIMTLEDTGVLQALTLIVGRLTVDQKAALAKYTNTEHKGGRSFK